MDSNFVVYLAFIVVIILAVFLLFTCSNKKAGMLASEKFYAGGVQPQLGANPSAYDSVAARTPTDPNAAASGLGPIAPSDGRNEDYNPVTSGPTAGGVPSGQCYPRDRLTAEDLLPKDAANSRWAQANPAGQGDISDMNMLSSGYHVGVMTRDNKLQSYDIRSEPQAPRIPVSAFNNSTITGASDVLRRPFEIGGSY